MFLIRAHQICVFIGMTLLLFSCSHRDKKLDEHKIKKIYFTSNTYINLPPVKDIMPPVEIYQAFQFQFDEKAHSTQAYINNTKDHLKIFIMSPIGAPLLQATYNGIEIKDQLYMPMKQKNMASYILADVILTYSPLDVLRKSLSKNLKIIETPLERSLIYDNVLWVKIIYSQKNRIGSNIVFKNFMRKYSFKINTKKVKEL